MITRRGQALANDYYPSPTRWWWRREKKNCTSPTGNFPLGYFLLLLSVLYHHHYMHYPTVGWLAGYYWALPISEFPIFFFSLSLSTHKRGNRERERELFTSSFVCKLRIIVCCHGRGKEIAHSLCVYFFSLFILILPSCNKNE